MSSRKSMTPRTSDESFNRSSFLLVKCKNCSADILKKDVERHDEYYCKNIEDFLCKKDWKNDISKEFDWDKDFGQSVILEKNLIVLSTFNGVSESDLPTNIKNLERALFLSTELMEHYNFENGQNITLYLKKDRVVQIYTLYKHTSRPKTMLTITIKKGSHLYKSFFPASEAIGNKVILDMDNSIKTVDLASIYLESDKRNDIMEYLTSCCKVQSILQDELIKCSSKTITINKIVLKIIKTDVINYDEDIERMLEAMNLNSNPKIVYRITSRTKIIFTPFSEITSDYVEMAGYVKQFNMIYKTILNSLKYYENNNIEITLPRSILLTGSTGTGKTIAMKKLFKLLEGKMNLFRVHASIFLSKQYEFENLKNFFDMFVKLRPSVLFLDNLEDVSNDKNALEKKFVSWLKVLLDSLPKSKPIFVIGACTELEMLDLTLRRPGRFDLEIDFPIPTPGTRKLILEIELFKTNSNLTNDQIEIISESTHGFTGADIKHLCDMSRLTCVDPESSNVIIKYDNVLQTLRKMKPSVMREISLIKPNLTWDQIGGMQQVRHLLEETVVWPIKHPQAFIRMGIEPPHGILMYGPPGCCKTMIGKALATESGLNFFSIKGPELFSKWVGESERAIREIFRKARAASPSILFFDEIDALAAERGQKQSAVGDRVLAQLLTEIDGVEKLSQVVIIAATNRPDIVDKALLRPGRLDSMVYVPLPNYETRKEIFRIRTEKMPLDESISREEFINDLASKSEGYTGAEVTAICQTAGLAALSDDIHSNSITIEHFTTAFQRVQPRIDAKMIEFYDEFSSRTQP